MKNRILLICLLGIGLPAAAATGPAEPGLRHPSAVSSPVTLAAHHSRKHKHQHRRRGRVVHTPVTGVEPRERRPDSLLGLPGHERPNTPSIPPGPETPLSSSAGPIDHNPPGTEMGRGMPSHRMPGTDMHPSPAGPIRP